MSKLDRFMRNFTWCWAECRNKGENKEKIDPTQEIVIFFVMGPSGSGKATVGKKLANFIGYTYINTSTLLENEIQRRNSNAKSIIEHMQVGSDIPSEIMTRLLKEFIDNAKNSKGFVISDFPKNIDQAQKFEFDVKKPKVIIYCSIPEDVYINRNMKKHGDVSIEVLKQKYENEHKNYQGLYRLYELKTLKVVTTSSVDEHIKKILKDLQYYWGFSFKM